MFNFIKRHKVISGLACVNIIAIIAVIIAVIVHHAKTATIDINVAPINAEITLNGRKYDNFESYEVLPGNYHVKIAMDGMQVKEYDINLANDGFVRIWDYLLDANGGYDYYFTHPEDEAALANIISEDDTAALEFIAEYEKIVSILNDLPLIEESLSKNGGLYGVNYMYDTVTISSGRDLESCTSGDLCLLVTDTSGTKEEQALQIIRRLGYDPNNYQIIYEKVDYEQN